MSASEPLPYPPLPPGASRDELLEWFNTAARPYSDPVLAVRRYGNTDQARIEIELKSGTLVIRQRDLAGQGVRNVFLFYDGERISAYSKADCEHLVAALIRAAVDRVADDELDTLLLDVDTFLNRCLYGHKHEPAVFITPNGDDDADPANAYYRAVANFRTVNRGVSGHPAEPPPVLTYDRTENRLWVPRGALETFLRAQRARVFGTDARNMLEATGWRQHDWDRTLVGSGRASRAKAKVWLCPVPWEPCAIDLEQVLDDAGSSPRPPESPLRSNAREDPQGPRAHRRGEPGGTGGRGYWDAPGRRATWRGPMTGQLITARQVADQLGLSTETVLRWARQGRLPAVHLSNRAIRFREAEVDAWLEERATSVKVGPENGDISKDPLLHFRPESEV